MDHRQENETIDTYWDARYIKKPQTHIGKQVQLRTIDTERNHSQTETM